MVIIELDVTFIAASVMGRGDAVLCPTLPGGAASVLATSESVLDVTLPLTAAVGLEPSKEALEAMLSPVVTLLAMREGREIECATPVVS